MLMVNDRLQWVEGASHDADVFGWDEAGNDEG